MCASCPASWLDNFLSVLDVAPLVGVAKRGLAVAVSAALFADNLDGFGERHVIDDLACAAARLARALGIEAE